LRTNSVRGIKNTKGGKKILVSLAAVKKNVKKVLAMPIYIPPQKSIFVSLDLSLPIILINVIIAPTQTKPKETNHEKRESLVRRGCSKLAMIY